jgi:PST family polysaccharide transporter
MERGKSFVRSTIRGTLWVYAALYSGKLLNLITITILARLLLKEDFGVAGYATVIVSFLDFPGLGIGPALIFHPREARRTNTAFWLSILIGLGMGAVMLAGAPLVGIYFRDERAVSVTRWMALYFPLVGLGVVPSALLGKELSFKRKFFPDLAGAIGKGILAITLALFGFGAWSMVMGNVVNTLITTIVLWIVWRSPWRPQLRFDREYAPSLLKYAGSIVSVYGLGILLLNVDYLIIGRYLGAAALGVYLLAFRIPELMIKQFYSAVSEVLFPIFTKMREETQDFGAGFLTTMRYIGLLTIPMAVGLALISDPLVRTFFGERWLEAIPILSAISLYTLVRSLYFSAGDVFKAQGRPEIITRLHLFNLALLVPALYFTALYTGNLVAVAWVQVAVVLVVGTVRLAVAARLLDLRVSQFAVILWPILLATTGMAAAVWGMLALTNSAAPLLRLIAAVLTGAATYMAALWWLERDVIVKAGQTLKTVLSKA